MRLRQHRGLLEDSLKTTVIIEPTKEALLAEINKSYSDWGLSFTVDDITIVKTMYDERCGWDTHLVEIRGQGVYGMTDGPVES